MLLQTACSYRRHAPTDGMLLQTACCYRRQQHAGRVAVRFRSAARAGRAPQTRARRHRLGSMHRLGSRPGERRRPLGRCTRSESVPASTPGLLGAPQLLMYGPKKLCITRKYSNSRTRARRVSLERTRSIGQGIRGFWGGGSFGWVLDLWGGWVIYWVGGGGRGGGSWSIWRSCREMPQRDAAERCRREMQ